MEELKPQSELNSNIETQSEIKPIETEKTNLTSLPRLEDLLKSEKQVKVGKKIEGLTQVKTFTQANEKEFAKKQDNSKAYLKRRIKTITGVYVAVASLLAIFAGVNVITLAVLNKQITTNTNTIQSQQQTIESIVPDASVPAGQDIPLILGTPPRDYDDDNKELTFLDKISILFRGIFG